MSDNEFDRSDIDAVARLRHAVPPPSAAVLAAARAQLGEHAERPEAGWDGTASRHAGHRRWAGALVAAASVAALATGAVVISSRDTGHPVAAPGTSAPSPAPTNAATSPDAVATQFLHITTHSWLITEAALKDRAVWYLDEGNGQTWVPADQSKTWYWDSRSSTDTRFLTDSDRDYVRANAPELLRSSATMESGADGMPTGGVGCAPSVCTPGWAYLTADFIRSLPSDPTQLRASLYAAAQKASNEANHYGKTDDVDSEAYGFLGDALALGYLSADLQGALYQVAKTIPDVTTVASETNLDGVAGVGLRRLDRFGDVHIDYLFSAAGGTYTGARKTVVSDSWNAHNDSNTDPPQPITAVPAGTVIEDDAVSVDTVTTPPNSVAGPAMPLPSS